jgi:cytochrome d ubiquinol oxidase subunit II
MNTAWFIFLAVMVTMYVVLDGFDLGVGALHLLVARNAEEREEATAAIGPVWSGNEVWLIAGGGVLFLAFPVAYAAAFSGLYFGLIIVLWLLVGRGLALELRHQIHHPMWYGACDAVFSLASAALALVFGVALGNVVRGVPLDSHGYFSLPLFHILNRYALRVGVFGLVVLSGHGANFLAWRGTGELRRRAAAMARRLAPVTVVLAAALAWPTYHVRHQMITSFGDHPWRLIFPVLALLALGALFVYHRREAWLRAFVSSAVFIVGLLTTMAAGLYPYILPARAGRPHGLTIDRAASGHTALSTAIVWWPLGIVLAGVYFAFAYRLFFRAEHASGGAGNA